MKRTWKTKMALVLSTVALAMTACQKTENTTAPKAEQSRNGEQGEEAGIRTSTNENAGSKTNNAPEEDSYKTVTMGVSALWETYNFLETNTINTDVIIEQMFDRLYVVNTDGTCDPRLAESWEMDGSKLVFHLNPDAKWQDGVPVTADDVVYTFRVWTNPDAGWLRTNNCYVIEGTDDKGYELSEDSVAVEALDEHTVQITLKQPNDQIKLFVSSFRSVEVLPSHLLADIPDTEMAKAEYWKAPVGSGPFIFDSEIDGERVELVANENYYLGKPDFDRLIIRYMNASTISAALLNGEVDISPNISISDLEILEADQNLTVESVTSSTFLSLLVNVKDETLDAGVREAIDAAINKQALVDQLLRGRGEPARSLYPMNHPYYNKKLSELTYNPEHAKKLLAESGWDGSRVLNLTTSDNEARSRVALLVQQDLAAVGIKTEIVTYDLTTEIDKMRKNEYDLLIMGSGGMVEPSGVLNSVEYFTNYTNPKFLDLAAKGKAELGFEKRKPVYDEYQEYYAQELPLIMLYFSDNLLCYNKRLSNIPFADSVTDFQINKLPWTWKVEN